MDRKKIEDYINLGRTIKKTPLKAFVNGIEKSP
jgi:hypothetical protein